ncbi:MAG TPA: cobyric acid synthase CobQ, partial [Symbiobacteriaceae bacterium]|nr:cobyric acid synthase CobQ [Symbiobacteriaceae bacterium]
MRARTLMVQGTASNAGKSLLVTALCRIFRQDGWRVAPFKSQNMSNNSYITADGSEIGRAQGAQAEAAGVPAMADMNPVLLKPSGDHESQVVIHGRPHANMDFRNYRREGYEVAAGAIRTSLGRLRAQYEVLVLEGAGSPAEVNL